MTATIEEFADYLVSVGLATREALAGCTPEEIAEVRKAQHIDTLPPQYEQFLVTMGRDAGEFLRGTTLFYPEIVELVDEMRETVMENDVSDLVQPGSVLIGMHQGVELYWMQPDGQTFESNESGPNPVHVWPTLVDCLRHEADTQLEIRKRIEQRKRQSGS